MTALYAEQHLLSSRRGLRPLLLTRRCCSVYCCYVTPTCEEERSDDEQVGVMLVSSPPFAPPASLRSAFRSYGGFGAQFCTADYASFGGSAALLALCGAKWGGIPPTPPSEDPPSSRPRDKLAQYGGLRPLPGFARVGNKFPTGVA